MTPSRDIARLLDIMAALRSPESGCPWDLAQDFSTIAPYTLEEAYEVADAIARGDLADLREELGDLLLQVVFHARMAQEQSAFDFGDVVAGHHGETHPPASACVWPETPQVITSTRRRLSKAFGNASKPKRPKRRPAEKGHRLMKAPSPACPWRSLP